MAEMCKLTLREFEKKLPNPSLTHVSRGSLLTLSPIPSPEASSWQCCPSRSWHYHSCEQTGVWLNHFPELAFPANTLHRATFCSERNVFNWGHQGLKERTEGLQIHRHHLDLIGSDLANSLGTCEEAMLWTCRLPGAPASRQLPSSSTSAHSWLFVLENHEGGQ